MTFCAKLTDLSEKHRNIPDDMNRRYQGSILLVTKDKTTFPALYRGYVEGNIYRFQTEREVMDISAADPDVDVDVFLPEVGYYNINGNVQYIIKSPERQWRRSFCCNIYRITSALHNEMNDTKYRDDIYIGIAKQILQPEYVHLDQITSSLFTNLAISKVFAILTRNSRQYLVYRKYIVGELNQQQRTIHLLSNVMTQEVKDLLKRTGVAKWTLV